MQDFWKALAISALNVRSGKSLHLCDALFASPLQPRTHLSAAPLQPKCRFLASAVKSQGVTRMQDGDLSVGTGGLPPTCISSVVSKGNAIWCIRSSRRSRVWHLHMPAAAQCMCHTRVFCHIFAPDSRGRTGGCRCCVLRRYGVAKQSAAAAATGAGAQAAACMRRC